MKRFRRGRRVSSHGWPDQDLSERRRVTTELDDLPVSTDEVPSEDAIALVARVGDLWNEMDDGERRAFVEEVFEEVRLGRDRTIAVRAREPYRELVFSSLDEWWSSDPSHQRDGTQLHHVTVEGLAEWIAWWDAQEASA